MADGAPADHLRLRLAQADLAHVLEHTAGLWAELRGERVLLTGGTGFFGRWLVESFLHANSALGLEARLTVLSRKPAAFQTTAAHLCANPSLELVAGDIRSFQFPAGYFGFVIHAATESVVGPATSPEAVYSAIAEGTRRVLECAAVTGARRVLLVSSGAVYGPQPARVSHLDEEQPFAATKSVYALGKRAAEALCLQSGLACTIARGFAFLGPHLPLDAHFAVGNFLRDALEGSEIKVNGDGRPLRSYLYAADLAIWLWTILLKGRAGRAYNVGSEDAVSISELAGRVAAVVAPGVTVRMAGETSEHAGQPARYVPSTQRARSELGLAAWIGLDEAIRRTAVWHRETR